MAETVQRTPQKEAGKQRSKAGKDQAALTVRVDGLAVRRPDGEHAGDQDVLEARNEEQRRVLVVERLELLVVDVGLGVPEYQAMSTGPHHACCHVSPIEAQNGAVTRKEDNAPRLLADPDKHQYLEYRVDDDLTNDTSEDLLGHKTCSRPFRVDFGVRQCSAHCRTSAGSSRRDVTPLTSHGDRNDDEKVNVQELEIAQTRRERVQLSQVRYDRSHTLTWDSPESPS